MRLQCIKLAGFKSFVDATTAYFPSNMTAVVGPNGCGKSNIIDAVRWVMGESSAKNLRGESMADVIFNGSNTRKPIGQASIELVFDNTETTLVGEYATCAEISIRRKVTRDGQNHYYLNGTRCRRKDITTIFLGTGLGSRSYSIIEQGMISRLIEARPEDLRHYIEEAAGISKYKERRRETENRIQRTQENLQRLTDIREELERQLERLHSQARAAEKYQQYKIEERQLKAELTTLRWRSLNVQAEELGRVIQGQEVALEAVIAQQRQADAHIEKYREQHYELSECFNQVQGQFYAIGGDIAKIEQSIQHTEQRLRQLSQDIEEVQRNYQETVATIEADTAQKLELEQAIEVLTPEQALLQAKAEETVAQLHELEEVMAQWQDQWDELNQKASACHSQAEVQQSHTQHFEQSLERIVERIQKLTAEQNQLTADPQTVETLLLQEQLAETDIYLEEKQWAKEEALSQLQQMRLELDRIGQQYQQQQNDNQRLAGKIASLEALQQAALHVDDGVSSWLQTQQLTHNQHLADVLRVDSGWELAVETVLGADLHAILCDQISTSSLQCFENGQLHIIQPTLQHTFPHVNKAPSLLDKIISKEYAPSWLATIITCASLDEALQQRAQLALGQSFITQDGYWIGVDFIRIKRGDQPTRGVLGRAKELEDALASYEQLDAVLLEKQQQLQQLTETVRQKEQWVEQANKDIQALVSKQGEIKTKLVTQQAKIDQVLARREYLQKEITELTEQQQNNHEALKEARILLQQALDEMAAFSEQTASTQLQRTQLQQQLDLYRKEERAQKDKAHQVAMQLTSLTTQNQAVSASLQRANQQLAKLAERKQLLALQQAEGEAPLDELRFDLETQLEKRIQVEDALKQARLDLETVDTQLRTIEQGRSKAEQQAQLLRTQLEQKRLDWQTINVRKKSLQEQLVEDHYDLQILLQNLPSHANEQEWSGALDKLSERIIRLGAINLAAIEEYQQQLERKTYLDSQNDDLVEALTTLENVIQKIDRETRQRFKETFDQINSKLKELFPKVFGGGEAGLELTGDDLLSTGVAIMARPPGKKNSTIHLLSGGEKALTALALVFAIFQLNPAPFCMLDEVDAPLDDTNVGRYANLVKEMSEKVQFIYITHNKIAMELADQLMGVTMHEPGCSRLVDVNVAEAVALVEV